MITAFTVKNFKAIGEEPVRIELKPITLLFGANSAGKSSILHALNYAYEIFNNLDPTGEKNAVDYNKLDLGGFKRFVHGNDLNRNIMLRFESDFNIEYVVANNSGSLSRRLDENFYNFYSILNPMKILSKATKAYAEVEISWSYTRKCAYVSRYETGINNEKIAIIRSVNNQVSLCYINTAHPIFNDLWIEHGISLDGLVEAYIESKFYTRKSEQEQIGFTEYECKAEENRGQAFKKFGKIPDSVFTLVSNTNNLNIDLRYQSDALPDFKDGLYFGKVWLNIVDEYQHSLRMSIDGLKNKAFALISKLGLLKIFSSSFLSQKARDLKKNNLSTQIPPIIFESLLSSILVAPGQNIANQLELIRYLGPLREIPLRNFTGDYLFNQTTNQRWATGLAAWDTLHWFGRLQSYVSAQSDKDNDKILIDLNTYAIQVVDTINDWLANSQRLNTGYRIIIERYREIPSTHSLFGVLTASNPLTDITEFANEILSLPEKIRIWLQDIVHGLKLTPHEIGVGISQVLPVVIASTFGRNWSDFLVTIEQPELHIHPAMQVQLADLFITQALKKQELNLKKTYVFNRSFLIETHSEHLLLRLLRRINETYEDRLPPDINPCTSDDVAVYYVKKESQGLRVRRLEISEDGDSKGDWPEGFFEERRAELF